MPVGKRATVQMVALVFGAMYLLAGILGFFNHPLLGIFQVNLVHNLVHVAIGVVVRVTWSSSSTTSTFTSDSAGKSFTLSLRFGARRWRTRYSSVATPACVSAASFASVPVSSTTI